MGFQGFGSFPGFDRSSIPSLAGGVQQPYCSPVLLPGTVAGIETLTVSGVFAGRYTIERELGRGGTAFVYLARDQRHGTPVAIKVLRLDVSQTIGAERFLKEIRLSAGLHHPHIMPVLDSGDHEGQLYFVLPHAEGGTLRNRLVAEKQLPLPEVLAITRTLATALDHAHAKGIIHRDVKPENVLFTSGHACLADFGIARGLLPGTGESMTSEGLVRGTPAYMSPEQAGGDEVLDGRSDLYALGCVVYEMLSGMRPFEAPTAASLMAMRLTETPRSVRIYRPSLPSALDAVLSRALAVTPADRFQSGAEFAQALEAAAEAAETTERPRAAIAGKRRAIGALSLALTAAAAAAVLFLSRDAGDAAAIPEGDPRRVAVMYLDNLTPDAMPTHVADGITEDIIDQLGNVRVLHVTSTYGVRQFRGRNVGVDSIRQALKVGTIITGSIGRAGDSVRLNIRLVDGASSQQLATIPSLVVPWSDVSVLGSKLAERIAFTLRQRIGDRVALTQNRATTKSALAWATTQQASAVLRRALQTYSVPLLIEADTLYARAARIDPAWELPWIRRGPIALTLGILPSSPAPPGLDSVQFAAMRRADRSAAWYRYAIALADSAVQRNARSARALELRGEARYRQSLGHPDGDSLRARAERDLRSALEIRPDAAGAWTSLTYLLIAEQRYAEAADAARRGYDADPYFERRNALNGAFFSSLYARQFDDARRWCRIAKDHYADDPRFAECELTILGWTGRTSDDLAAAARLAASIERGDTAGYLVDTRAYRRLMVAAVAARAGARDSALRVLAALRAQRGDTIRQNTAMGESYVWLLLSNRDSAVAILDRFLKDTPEMRRGISRHPWFEPLHTDARFAALVSAAK